MRGDDPELQNLLGGEEGKSKREALRRAFETPSSSLESIETTNISGTRKKYLPSLDVGAMRLRDVVIEDGVIVSGVVESIDPGGITMKTVWDLQDKVEE